MPRFQLSLIGLFLLVACAHHPTPAIALKSNAPPAIEKHYVDPRGEFCSYGLTPPASEDSNANPAPLWVVQMGSGAFSFEQGSAKEAINFGLPGKLGQIYLLEVDQPGILSNRAPDQGEAVNAWYTKTFDSGLQVFRLRRSYLWGSDEYARCHLKAIEEVFASHGPRPILLLGFSMGGEIMVRLLTLLDQRPELGRWVRSVALAAAVLEESQAMIKRQLEYVNRDFKGETLTFTENVTDPKTGQVQERKFTELVPPPNFKQTWKSILRLRAKDFPDHDYFPTQEQVGRIYYYRSDFSNFYLQALHRNGAAAKSLLKHFSDDRRYFIYQGLKDWRVDPSVVQWLERSAPVSHSDRIRFRYYDAGHDLGLEPAFLRDLNADLGR